MALALSMALLSLTSSSPQSLVNISPRASTSAQVLTFSLSPEATSYW